jgi:hypothetical protein
MMHSAVLAPYAFGLLLMFRSDYELLGSNGLLSRTGLPLPANFGRERRTSVPIQTASPRGSRHCCKSRRVPCAKTVPESEVFMPLGLALSEKQIPQITENTEKSK